MSPATRLLIESGILAGLVTIGIWVGSVSTESKAQAHTIQLIQEEQKVLARDLVETQKAMIKDLTEIKTILKQQH